MENKAVSDVFCSGCERHVDTSRANFGSRACNLVSTCTENCAVVHRKSILNSKYILCRAKFGSTAQNSRSLYLYRCRCL